VICFIKINGKYADRDEVLKTLNGFKEIKLPLFSPKIREYSLQDRLSNRAWFLATMLFNGDYSNDRLIGEMETISGILRDEKHVDPYFIDSIYKFKEMLKTREIEKYEFKFCPYCGGKLV